MEKAEDAKEANETINDNAHIIGKDHLSNETGIEDIIDDYCCTIL